ncbi:SH3 domain-containing protein [Stappia sp.]|uniref:SH3 domain-containing protein n=1 Tax=Stappia sp. TaxID=1870903 RepID=UPI003D13D65A
MKGFFQVLAMLAALLSVHGTAAAQDVRSERLRFAPGTNGAQVEGRISGFESVDYVLGARAGQRLDVALQSRNRFAYFNVLAPGSDRAIFIGSRDGARFDAALPASGDYRIRVYLMRNAARRNERARYSLSVSVEGRPAERPRRPAPDYADGLAGGPDFWEVTGVGGRDYLNVRTGPGTRNPVIARLSDGDVLRNLGCRMVDGQRWCNVERPRGGDAGWVAGTYLREASIQPRPGRPEPPQRPGRPSRPDPEPDAHGPDFWEVTGIGGRDYLNVRTGPGTRNPVIARLSDGEVLRNLGCRMVDGQRWCNVERPRGGDAGWVAAAFLREAASQPQPGRPERPRRPRFDR